MKSCSIEVECTSSLIRLSTCRLLDINYTVWSNNTELMFERPSVNIYVYSNKNNAELKKNPLIACAKVSGPLR